MRALHIRDLPEEVVEALKQRAARNHRSLQEELRYILISLAREEPTAGTLPPIRLKLSAATEGGEWRREDIYGDDGR
jgi:plasmid stability protein